MVCVRVCMFGEGGSEGQRQLSLFYVKGLEVVVVVVVVWVWGQGWIVTEGGH